MLPLEVFIFDFFLVTLVVLHLLSSLQTDSSDLFFSGGVKLAFQPETETFLLNPIFTYF